MPQPLVLLLSCCYDDAATLMLVADLVLVMTMLSVGMADFEQLAKCCMLTSDMEQVIIMYSSISRGTAGYRTMVQAGQQHYTPYIYTTPTHICVGALPTRVGARRAVHAPCACTCTHREHIYVSLVCSLASRTCHSPWYCYCPAAMMMLLH